MNIYNRGIFSISPKRDLVIICGTNGIGKTTLFHSYKDQYSEIPFVNPDIAQKNAETNAFGGGCICLNNVKTQLIPKGCSFIMETTGAGPGNLIRLAYDNHYHVKCTYIGIQSMSDLKECCDRIAERVEKNGHFVAPKIVQRHYIRGLGRLPTFLPLCEKWEILDHTKRGNYILVASGCFNENMTINDKSLYETWVNNYINVLTNNLSSIGWTKTQKLDCIRAMQDSILFQPQYKDRIAQLMSNICR